MTMRNFIKCMAPTLTQKRRRCYSRQIGLVKKKKNCVTNWGKKRIKELENRTMCVTNWGKGAQRT